MPELIVFEVLDTELLVEACACLSFGNNQTLQNAFTINLSNTDFHQFFLRFTPYYTTR